MEKDRKFRALAIAAICVAIVGVSVAYAALSATLNISGTATVSTAGAWKISINTPACTKTGLASCDPATPSISGTTLTWGAKFVAPGDTVTVTANIVNEGTIDAVLDSIQNIATVKEGGDQDILKFLTYTVQIGSTTIASDTTKVNKALLNKNNTGKNSKVLTITLTFADNGTAEKPGELTAEKLAALNNTVVNFTLVPTFNQKTTEVAEL